MMGLEEKCSQGQLIIKDDFSSERSVCPINTSYGVGYRIKARVLPYLIGFIYLVPTVDSEWIMIDSGGGSEESNTDLENGFRIIREEFDRSFKPEKISRLCLTHAHVDHFGGVSEFKRRTNAKIAVHAFESRLVDSYDEVARVENCRYVNFLLESGVPFDSIKSILDGFGFRAGRVQSVTVDEPLYGGETIDSLKSVYLPGHSSGHLAFVCENVIFSGDLLLSKTLSQIWPARMTPQTGILNYVRSLLKLKQIAIDYELLNGQKLIAFPAHEEPIFDIPSRVDKALRGMERRNNRLLKLFSEETAPMTLWEILPKMYWSGRPNREFFALSDIGSRVELFLQLNLLRVADSERLSRSNPAIRYQLSFANAEAAKNTIKQVVRMCLSGDKSNLI